MLVIVIYSFSIYLMSTYLFKGQSGCSLNLELHQGMDLNSWLHGPCIPAGQAVNKNWNLSLSFIYLPTYMISVICAWITMHNYEENRARWDKSDGGAYFLESGKERLLRK